MTRNEEQQNDRDRKNQERLTSLFIAFLKKFINQEEEENWNKEFSNKLIIDLKVTVKKKLIHLGTFKTNNRRNRVTLASYRQNVEFYNLDGFFRNCWIINQCAGPLNN